MTNNTPQEQWGVGSAAESKAFAKSFFRDGREFELIHGDFPHSKQDNRIYARLASGHIEDFSGHMAPVRIELEEYNYMKESNLSGDEIRKGGEAKIYISNVQVYSLFFREISKALNQVHELLPKLFEHAVQLWRPEEVKRWEGRKIYYRETPAIIERFILDQGAIIIRAESGQFPVPCWDKDEHHYEREADVKEDILSPHIWWWRD